MLLLVNPNNPTGTYVKRSELEAFGRARPGRARRDFRRGVLRFHLSETAQDAGNAAADARVRDVLARRPVALCALPQMKLAWIVMGGPDEAVARCAERLELIADTDPSAATPVQLALPELLRIGRPAAERIRERLRQNLRAAADAFCGARGIGDLPCRIPRAAGASRWSSPPISTKRPPCSGSWKPKTC